MQRGIDYQQKDKVILKTLSDNPELGSFISHRDYSTDDMKSMLDSSGVSYIDSHYTWSMVYNLFASKNKDLTSLAKSKVEESDRDDTRGKYFMSDVLKEAGLPKCCIDQQMKDHDSGIASIKRLALQSIDLSRTYNPPITGYGISLKDIVKDRGPETLVSVGERKSQWTSEETKYDEPDEGREIVSKAGPEMRRTALNIGLSKELLMCDPSCEGFYKNITEKRIDSIRDLGYSMKSIIEDVGEFVENEVYEFCWGRSPGNGLKEIDKIAENVKLENINSSADLEKSEIKKRDILRLKQNHTEIIHSS